MNIQRLIGLYCLAFLLAGCSNWLDVQPYDQISEDELVKSEEGFQKALNGIYIGLNDEALYGKSLTVEMIEIMGGAYEIGNESLVWGNYTDLKDYNYNTEYWRSCMSSTWDKAYALILNCNKLLENMKSREELFTGNNYNIIQGEALALRAMLHFDMLRLFGPVYSRNPEATSIPYYTSEVLSPEPLLPASEVMTKIIQDLQEARILLNEDPVKTEGGLSSGNAGESSNFLCYRALRLNYYAVTGLLARVCLYAGQRENAFNYSTEVIKASNNGIFPFVDRSLVNGTRRIVRRIFRPIVSPQHGIPHGNRFTGTNYLRWNRNRRKSGRLPLPFQLDFLGKRTLFLQIFGHDGIGTDRKYHDPLATAGRNVPDRRRKPIQQPG